ncbi:MAG TPA: hypothetical protein VF123_19680 [Candidatus Sulfotelmatobacter sp.]
MAIRRICPTPPRDEAAVQMAKDCERHVRILQDQQTKAREMTKVAQDMMAQALSMRRVRRPVLP